MYIQNLSTNILNSDEIKLISDLQKLKQTVIAASYVIFIKRELISKTESNFLDIIKTNSQNTNYIQIYNVFINMINNNQKLSKSIFNFIESNIRFINPIYQEDFVFNSETFEKEVIEKFHYSINNVSNLLSIISKMNNNNKEFKICISKFKTSDKIIEILVDSNLQNLLSSYLHEINSNTNSLVIDENIKATQELNRRLISEISNLQSQLHESPIQDKYKDVLLNNLTEKMTIMQIEQVENNLEDELENKKMLNEKLKTQIEKLQEELKNKSLELDNTKCLLLDNVLEIDKCKHLFILMSFYALTITLILIIYIRNNNKNRKCVLDKYRNY